MVRISVLVFLGGDMLTKLCKCGKKIEVNKDRCDTCNSRHSIYDSDRDKVSKSFYGGGRWVRLSKAIRTAYPYDLYAYHVKGRVVPSEIVHHIIPLKERPDLGYNEGNLISLSHASHNEIEQVYSQGGTRKGELQRTLLDILKMVKEG